MNQIQVEQSNIANDLDTEIIKVEEQSDHVRLYIQDGFYVVAVLNDFE